VAQACPHAPQLTLSLVGSTQLPLQLSIVPAQEEPPPVALVPPVLVELFPVPPVLFALFPVPPVLFALFPAALFPVSPPLGKAPSGGAENEPHAAATTAPSDTTTDTGMRERIFFMATSPIAKPPDVGLSKGGRGGRGSRALRLACASLNLRCLVCSTLKRLHCGALDGEPLVVAREELREALRVPRFRLDWRADALCDPRVEKIGQ
jgi:hypothetical protein